MISPETSKNTFMYVHTPALIIFVSKIKCLSFLYIGAQRVGRTGRAGRSGKSISYVTRSDWGSAGELIKILEEADQDVPDELRDMKKRFDDMQARKERERQSLGMGGGGGGRRSVFTRTISSSLSKIRLCIPIEAINQTMLNVSTNCNQFSFADLEEAAAEVVALAVAAAVVALEVAAAVAVRDIRLLANSRH